MYSINRFKLVLNVARFKSMNSTPIGSTLFVLQSSFFFCLGKRNKIQKSKKTVYETEGIEKLIKRGKKRTKVLITNRGRRSLTKWKKIRETNKGSKIEKRTKRIAKMEEKRISFILFLLPFLLVNIHRKSAVCSLFLSGVLCRSSLFLVLIVFLLLAKEPLPQYWLLPLVWW